MTRVRFAPNLTGPLFVSGARVALANHLFARRANGRVLLRLDDLDDAQSRASRIEQAEQDLRWLGIEWHARFQQSERLEAYQAAISRLKRDSLLYPCFESSEELKAKQEFRRKRRQPVVYDRAMLALTGQQRQAAETGGKRPHWRLKLPDRTLQWHDLILGELRVALPTVSDPILVTEDGRPMPILASVVDDLDFATTHLIRGPDSAGNTAVRIVLFEALVGAPARVRFAHLPALGGDGTSAPGPRVGNLSLRSLRHDGVEPPAIAACMTGMKPGQEDTPTLGKGLAASELIDLAHVSFDAGQILETNCMVLRRLDFAAVADRLPAGASEAFWLAVRGSLDLLNEARLWWDIVTGTIMPPVMRHERDLLATAAALLPPEPWDTTVWGQWVAALKQATGRPVDTLLPPLRLALTGEESGPELADLLPLIGRPKAAIRLKAAA